jgi:hypothetical protein
MTNQTIATQFKVTESQMSMAHRVVDMAARRVFFVVESQTTPGVEYQVTYNRQLHALLCLPFNGGPVCGASQNGIGCWHKRAACAVAAEYKAEEERNMAELQAEIDAEAREYTVQVSETSCSLDGQKWEMRNGKNIPMR